VVVPTGQDLDIACRDLVELVTDYLEGDLDQPTKAAVEAHLQECPACQRYLEQMRATVELLGRVPLETLDESSKRRLLAAFRGLIPQT